MTAVSRPPIITGDSCYTPLSPLGSPSSHPPTPAHLLPSKPLSAASSPAPQRNHRRTASPSRSGGNPPSRPSRPQVLARPSQGYPFPLMLSRANSRVGSAAGTPQPESLPSLPSLRKTPAADDGWGTPPQDSSAPASAKSNPANRQDDAPELSSTFSDSTASSSACSTPEDAAAALTRHRSHYPASKSPLSASFPARTPGDASPSRTKHAGSTPGAPPPAPFVKLAHHSGTEQSFNLGSCNPAAGDDWDAIEAAAEAEEKTPGTPALAVARQAKKTSTSSGLAGLAASGAAIETLERGDSMDIAAD
ncbi:hypothetical protein JCM11641_003333 [Rhodosporidiobolus odoratus]